MHSPFAQGAATCGNLLGSGGPVITNRSQVMLRLAAVGEGSDRVFGNVNHQPVSAKKCPS